MRRCAGGRGNVNAPSELSAPAVHGKLRLVGNEQLDSPRRESRYKPVAFGDRLFFRLGLATQTT